MSADSVTLAVAEKISRKSTIEIWTLLGIGLAATVLLRTYAQLSAVGFRNLRPSDYLAWVDTVRVLPHHLARIANAVLIHIRRYSTPANLLVIPLGGQ